MATNRQSVFTFLNVTESLTDINHQRLEDIRSTYASMTNAKVDDRLKLIADKFSLLDDAINLEYLNICVTSSTLQLACENIIGKYFDASMAEQRNKRRPVSSTTTTTTSSSSSTSTLNNVIRPREQNTAPSTNTETLTTVICQILVKENQIAVIEFIRYFLLCPLAEVGTGNRSKKNINILDENTFAHGPVLLGSTLDTFIRSQLAARGGTIDVGRPLSKLPLVNPINLVDEFDTWYFDHLRGLFELNLVPEGQHFPRKWKLATDAKFRFLLQTPNSSRINDENQEQATRNIDRPSTISLERFVEEVCEKENNGMAKKWLDALRADDLTSFDHLANLKFTEWTELKVLSMNGKKVLKSYVDREKQLASDSKASQKAKNSNQNHKITSTSELLACIHQIKLYFHYVLSDEFAAAGVATPAKLDARCVRLSFEEMRQDGFADDGLFDQMKLFFLPLTMIEKDLSIDEARANTFARVRSREREQLSAKRQELLKELSEKEDEYYRHDESIAKLRNNMYTRSADSFDANNRRYEKFSPMQLIDVHQKEVERLELVRNDLRTRIQAIENNLRSNERGLTDEDIQDGKKTDRDLIKPNRGFIMYGPPGTGKSDIMSKLSVRMGISMVAPPIAAGELNRPLVGESERVISDICMRCHRTPYLMCCVSIDEIDSLAPKRKDDSSDGNVAKLSVLLSVIDGIKDVPNLMIFCATNRLHMMDEAFLRRMSGKFFVGRPSSEARKTILSGTKSWHISSVLLESLTMATTNFSGAALRALRRLITVHCVDAERENSRYQLNYSTMLQLADITARQFRILIGAETLPTLLLRAHDSQQGSRTYEPTSKAKFNDLISKRNSMYTGKVLVNLHARRIEFEGIHIYTRTGERKKIIYPEPLLDSETNLQELLERLTVYGKSRNVQLLQLIDLNLLSAESAYDEKQKFEILKERLDECAAYRRSMIVYDLDSLIGVNRSEGNSSMGRSTNFSLINHNIYTHIKEKFQNTPIQTASTTENDTTVTTDEKWSVMVIRDPFLLRQFCDDVQFTRLPSEIEEEKAEMRRANEQIKCVQCNDNYIEQDNKMGSCVHHDGFVYDNLSLTLQEWGQRAAIEQLLKEEAQTARQGAGTPELKERLEREKQRFKYICCNQTVQALGAMNGCKRGKHSSPNVTLIEWEHTCNNNREYKERRLNLLQTRARPLH